jgi:WD40 repeat protein
MILLLAVVDEGLAAGFTGTHDLDALRAALRTLEGHKGSIQSVAFAPNGATLATASSDDTVGLWKAR